MAGASGRRIRPIRVLFALMWAALSAAGAASALADGKTVLGLPTVTEADRPYVLGAAAVAGVLALLLLATSRPRAPKAPVAEESTRRRPVRVALGVLSGVAGGMALATSELSVEPALMAGGLTGGGAFSLLVSFWSFLTSKRHSRREDAITPRAERPDRAETPGPGIALESDLVAQQLRSDGWFVVEGMHLGAAYADYVAAGAAGVLAIQTFWTDRADDGTETRARARIAADKVRGVLHSHELPVDVVPVVLVCGPLPEEVNEAVAIIDNVAVLVARRSEEWRAELQKSDALGVERFEAVRDLLADLDPAELATV